MKIRSIVIRNFRGLTNIETSLGDSASVIVGPNAIGKTTFLEAIRLTRCLLAPRFPNEQNDVLTQMGAVSPHTRMFQYSSLVSDMGKPLEIQMSIELNEAEVAVLRANAGRLALLHVRSTSAVPASQDDLALIQYLSSPQGQQNIGKGAGLYLRRVNETPGQKDPYNSPHSRWTESTSPWRKPFFSGSSTALGSRAATFTLILKLFPCRPSDAYGRNEHSTWIC